MRTTLTPDQTEGVLARLGKANRAFNVSHPGESDRRQPIHTVYGGAHLFKAGTAARMGAVGLRTLKAYAPTFVDLARALGGPESAALPTNQDQVMRLQTRLAVNPAAVRREHPAAWRAYTVYERVLEKMRREPVEDFRIDFEDGFGNRPDAEEDAEAVRSAEEVVRGMDEGVLPPFLGIRIKPLTEDLKARATRTLDLFFTTLLAQSEGRLPDHFVVTLPKVTIPQQVESLVALFKLLEARFGLVPGTLQLELMVETPRSIIDSRGNSALPSLVVAAEGRCVAAHFGVYDYTASCNITAAYQSMTHPACDFARHAMMVALAGTGIWLSDGATNVMPVGVHRAPKDGPPLTEAQQRENREAVHRTWRLGSEHIRHSLENGYYQGWDLHPAQLPIRFATVFSFFLEGFDAAASRLKSFMDQAAQATLLGNVFDDAATGQALLNYFLRGLNCGAITEDEARQTGLSLEEIRSRSFYKILEGLAQ